MPKFTIDYTFNATAMEIIEADTLEGAERIIDGGCGHCSAFVPFEPGKAKPEPRCPHTMEMF